MDFLSRWDDTVKMLKEKTLNQEYYPGKTVLQKWGWGKVFLGKQKLREFVTAGPTL